MQEEIQDDPATYRELSKPFPDAGKANEALQNFAKGVRELRIKHAIPDVYIVVCVNFISSDGTEGQAMISSHLGDELKAESMTAYAYGAEQALRQERIGSVIARSRNKSVSRAKGGK